MLLMEKIFKLPYLSPLQFTDSLMYSFVEQTEEVICLGIARFTEIGPQQDTIEICAEDGIYEHVEYYYGLSDVEVLSNDTFLDNVFLEYFPSLNRRSAFQTIYSSYEAEMTKLCEKYSLALGGKKFKNFDGIGLLKVSNFINYHFPSLINSPEWGCIDKLRLLRNSCIHNDGKIYRSNNRPITEIYDLIEEHPDLFHCDGAMDIDESGDVKKYPNGSSRRKGQNIVFESGSLLFTIKSFQSYVEKVDKSYQKKTK